MKKKSQKTISRKSKLALIACALILPLASSGLVYSLTGGLAASSASSISYATSYIEEVSMTNNNFASSTASNSLSTSISGWSGQVTNSGTTAGIISTGSSFQNYMADTYHLFGNPGAKSTDDAYILMINSLSVSTSTSTTDDEDYNEVKYNHAKQGYASSDITLDANSYYAFQVSFKSDVNYDRETSYTKKAETSDETSLDATNFTNAAFGEYVQFTYNNKVYYIQKNLASYGYVAQHATATVTSHGTESYLKDCIVFYEDDEYVGVIVDTVTDSVGGSEVISGGVTIFVSVDDVYDDTTSTDNIADVKIGAAAYICENITYSSTTASGKNYTVASGTSYYETSTTYTPLTANTYGSIYLSGLTDEDGEDVSVSFENVSSGEWVTFYFYVATGDEEQTVNLELWLGSKTTTASGVVFFDDCHVYKYSENAFWKEYQTAYGKSYTQTYTSTSGTTTESETTNCVQLADLRTDNTIDYSDANFDFEAGIYNESTSSLKGWTKDEQSTGNARVFNVDSASYFKSLTGYDFVGSTMSAKVTLDENDKVTYLAENTYALALWAEDGYVKVTSQDVEIKSNEVYKITVYYKISEIDGNAYMIISENDTILSTYNLSEDAYSLLEETSSSAVTENGDDAFVNNYGTIEFYVKGSALYNSSINITLALGNSDETATGCIVFDQLSVEYSTTEEYSDATNAVELGTITDTTSITNGNFNTVTVTDGMPYSPDDWTIDSSESGLNFAGVINTDSNRYSEYVALYKENQQNENTSNQNNPFLWVYPTNPGSSTSTSNGKAVPNNILMLANVTSTWQKVTSPTISLSADTDYSITFSHKIFSDDLQASTFTVSAYSSDGVELFTSDEISNNGTWQTYTLYLQNGSGASEIYLEINFGTSGDEKTGYLYLDNFKLTSGVTVPEDESANNIIDMTNFYLNLPTNSFTSDLASSSTTAYTYAVASGSASAMSGGIVTSEKFENSEIFKIEKENEDDEIYVFFIESQAQGSYTITSNYNIDLTADSYYVLTFKVKTHFEGELDSDTTYSYGLTAGLTGFDYLTEVRTDDTTEADEEGYVTFTMYFNPSEDTSSQLYFALVCDADETRGAVAIYDITFEESDEDTYTAAQDTVSAKGYDQNTDRVFVSAEADAEEEEEDDTTEDEDSDSEADYSWLLYISTLIFGLAIIVAIVGWALRHVRIKKIERKKRESYDRKDVVDMDIVHQKAVEQRDEELAKVQEVRAKFQKELDTLEAEHKANVVALRENKQGKLTKVTDKEFKQYAQKRTVISEKIDSLDRQIVDMRTPEYLLNVERKVYVQEEAKRKELLKVKKEVGEPETKATKTGADTTKANKTATNTAERAEKSENKKAEKKADKNSEKESKANKADKNAQSKADKKSNKNSGSDTSGKK